MADGSRSHAQRGFNFQPLTANSRLRAGEIVVDLFAGGGGASTALEAAIGRPVDIAINHDPWAVGMHAANHPYTRHLCQDVWEADPRAECAGRPVGVLHASPDCTHFSQAKGGQPRSRATRSLSWVVLRWAGTVRPRIITLENVREILKWGPLVAKRDRTTGRVVRLDGTVAAPGERVPLDQQYLVPDKRHEGRTWRQFVATLRGMGYAVDWKRLRACDYGAGTSRERLFMVARCDGQPIAWPEPTHGTAPDRRPMVAAADCIDFGDLGRSIFDRPRPLAEATMRRIARGVVRHVLQASDPFFLTEFANASTGRTWSAAEPLRTQCAGVKGGHFAVVAPTLVQTGYGEREGQSPRSLDIRQPLGTAVAGGVKHALVAALLEQACSGYYTGADQNLRTPAPTICAKGSIQRLVSADLGELSPEVEAGALRVAAFLINYYGQGTALDLRDPLATVTTRDRLALVTVHVGGVPHVITDIRLRMLRPAELYRAQGFPPEYIIDRTADGRPISTTAAVRMVGNSVSPPPLAAILDSNLHPAHRADRIAA